MGKFKHLLSFEEKIEEGRLHNLALAGLMGASALTGSAQNHHKKDKEMVKRTTQDLSIVNTLLKRGYTINKVDTLKLIDTLGEASVDVYLSVDEIDLSQGFNSGSFELNNVSKSFLKNMFDSLYENEIIVSKIEIEASTDKTPISTRMQLATGIKDNRELSEARFISIIDFLKSENLLNPITEKSIEKNILVEQGTENDPSKRYVKLILTTIKENTAFTLPDIISKEEITYHLSKPYKIENPDKNDSSNHKITNKSRMRLDRNNKRRFITIACPMD